MPKKKMTIEGLAVMVNKGFNDVIEQFDRRFIGIDGRLDGIDGRLDKIERRQDHTEGILNTLSLRIEEIERTLAQHTEILEAHMEELRWIHKKIDDWTHPDSDQRLISYNEYMELVRRVERLETKAKR